MHHEWAAPALSVRLVAWGLGTALAAAGVALAAVHDGTALEPVGMFLGLAGVIAIIAVWRCGRWETVVGSARLTCGAGPFRHRVPLGFIADVGHRPASGWRRAFAAEEVVVELVNGLDPLRMPSCDPATLIAAVDAAVERDGSAPHPPPRPTLSG